MGRGHSDTTWPTYLIWQASSHLLLLMAIGGKLRHRKFMKRAQALTAGWQSLDSNPVVSKPHTECCASAPERVG